LTVSCIGHADAPHTMQACLRDVLTELIETRGACKFYVGTHGGFDRMAERVLYDLKGQYPHVQCFAVLSHMPREHALEGHLLDTLFPAEVAVAMPRFAICRRNEWMIRESDAVITFVHRACGGAAKYKRMALAQGKEIIELSALM